MASFDDNGLNVKKLADVLEEFAAYLKRPAPDGLGLDADTNPDSVLGNLLAVIAEPFGGTEGLWPLLQQIVDSYDPDNATGKALDNICDINGLVRQPAVAASGKVRCYTNAIGVEITSGSIVRKSATGDTYSITDGGTSDELSSSTLSEGATAGVNFIVCVDNTSFQIGDWLTIEVGTAREELVQVASLDEDTQTVNLVGYLQYDHAVSSAVACYGVDLDAEATEAKAQTISNYQIDTIVTAIAGWKYVLNVASNPAWSNGADVETDEELRLRRVQSQQIVGAGTDGGIRARLQQLDFIESCNVVSNRTMDMDTTTKQPAKSVWPLVYPAALTDAQKEAVLVELFQVAPAGIEVWGGKQKVKFTIDDAVSGHVYSVTINDVVYSVTATGGDTKQTIAYNIKDQIVDETVVATYTGGNEYLEVEAADGYGYFSYEATSNITITNDESHIYGLITDEQGYSQRMGFGTAIEKPLYLNVAVRTSSSFPTDGETQIKAALIDFVNSKRLGEDIYSSDLYEVISSITGVTDVQLQLDWSAHGSWPSFPLLSYSLAVEVYEFATLDTANIDYGSF